MYLNAGSELTEKWYSKTHATFLKRYTTYSSFICDLINSNGYLLNANSYRKLIHFVWAGENFNPNQLTFDEVRMQTQSEKIFDLDYLRNVQFHDTLDEFQVHVSIC